MVQVCTGTPNRIKKEALSGPNSFFINHADWKGGLAGILTAGLVLDVVALGAAPRHRLEHRLDVRGGGKHRVLPSTPSYTHQQILITSNKNHNL